jgi:hypothetical protein
MIRRLQTRLDVAIGHGVVLLRLGVGDKPSP